MEEKTVDVLNRTESDRQKDTFQHEMTEVYLMLRDELEKLNLQNPEIAEKTTDDKLEISGVPDVRGGRYPSPVMRQTFPDRLGEAGGIGEAGAKGAGVVRVRHDPVSTPVIPRTAVTPLSRGAEETTAERIGIAARNGISLPEMRPHISSLPESAPAVFPGKDASVRAVLLNLAGYGGGVEAGNPDRYAVSRADTRQGLSIGTPVPEVSVSIKDPAERVAAVTVPGPDSVDRIRHAVRDTETIFSPSAFDVRSDTVPAPETVVPFPVNIGIPEMKMQAGAVPQVSVTNGSPLIPENGGASFALPALDLPASSLPDDAAASVEWSEVSRMAEIAPVNGDAVLQPQKIDLPDTSPAIAVNPDRAGVVVPEKIRFLPPQAVTVEMKPVRTGLPSGSAVQAENLELVLAAMELSAPDGELSALRQKKIDTPALPGTRIGGMAAVWAGPRTGASVWHDMPEIAPVNGPAEDRVPLAAMPETKIERPILPEINIAEIPLFSAPLPEKNVLTTDAAALRAEIPDIALRENGVSGAAVAMPSVAYADVGPVSMRAEALDEGRTTIHAAVSADFSAPAAIAAPETDPLRLQPVDMPAAVRMDAASFSPVGEYTAEPRPMPVFALSYEETAARVFALLRQPKTEAAPKPRPVQQKPADADISLPDIQKAIDDILVYFA